jgi:hypothetical protein
MARSRWKTSVADVHSTAANCHPVFGQNHPHHGPIPQKPTLRHLLRHTRIYVLPACILGDDGWMCVDQNSTLLQYGKIAYCLHDCRTQEDEKGRGLPLQQHPGQPSGGERVPFSTGIGQAGGHCEWGDRIVQEHIALVFLGSTGMDVHDARAAGREMTEALSNSVRAWASTGWQ